MYENYEKFLEEYKQICKKYGLYISACGCCDSPWIVELEDEKDFVASINHLSALASGSLKNKQQEQELPNDVDNNVVNVLKIDWEEVKSKDYVLRIFGKIKGGDESIFDKVVGKCDDIKGFIKYGDSVEELQEVVNKFLAKDGVQIEGIYCCEIEYLGKPATPYIKTTGGG